MTTFAKIFSAELEGIRARLIEVEVDLHAGLHAFNIVGLADKALNEAKERVNSALKNSGAKPPNRENRKITVNLAPADVKKTGSQYDLAIALGYLLATKQIGSFSYDRDKTIFLGELALDGRVRPIDGALNIAQMAQELAFTTVILPKENAEEASVIPGVAIVPIETLEQLIALVEGRVQIAPAHFSPREEGISSAPDFSEIKGQDAAKRAMIIAAAGGHNAIMIGSPGVGKSLLAQALVGILPRLTIPEAIEITKIYSAAGLSNGKLVRERPFRSPHQTASAVSIIGGGTNPKPGEISLAHRGILFLDEVPEFQKNVLEALRGPLESGVVHVARAKGTLIFPAKFSLIAAMNPCPCGYAGDPEKECKCAPYESIRYQKKISGPLMDRIDLQLKVQRVKVSELRANQTPKPESEEIKKHIEGVRTIQAKRFTSIKRSITVNAEMSAKEAEHYAHLTPQGELFLKSLEKTRLSPRGYYRLLKTARTIADLETAESVSDVHLAEAFSYRLKEEI